MELAASKTRRILWALNHRTLMPDELSVLRELGFRVFTPRQLPRGVEGRSTRLEFGNDWSAGLPPDALAVLAGHAFYERRWSATVAEIINQYFDVVVTAFYPACFSSAVQGFRGLVVARAFGREGEKTYADLVSSWGIPGLEQELAGRGERYVFGQAYAELAEVEPTYHAARAATLPLPAPSWVNSRIGSWHGGDRQLVFNCPLVNDASYYGKIYADIKDAFEGLPHIIFGRQHGAVADSAVMGSPSDTEVLDLFAGASAFLYTSSEARHLHYSPIEAAMVGTPVLYRRGALLDRLAGEVLPGACADLGEMRRKAQSLLDGNASLQELIRKSQSALLSSFGRDKARAAWSSLLHGAEEAACFGQNS